MVNGKMIPATGTCGVFCDALSGLGKPCGPVFPGLRALRFTPGFHIAGFQPFGAAFASGFSWDDKKWCF
jgi:hypothetical protein